MRNGVAGVGIAVKYCDGGIGSALLGIQPREAVGDGRLAETVVSVIAHAAFEYSTQFMQDNHSPASSVRKISAVVAARGGRRIVLADSPNGAEARRVAACTAATVVTNVHTLGVSRVASICDPGYMRK